MKKKFMAIFLALVLCLSMVACNKEDTTSSEEVTTEEGADETIKVDSDDIAQVYPVSVAGFGGDMEVKVTLAKDKIEDIEVQKDYETQGVGKLALELVRERILDGQSVNVDEVSGATVSSKALKKAVKTALEDANMDVEMFSNEYKVETDYEKELEADVIVIGGGGAGLAAAVVASDNDSSVIVIEKNGFLGGNTVLCGGIYNAPDPEFQEPQGIEDSPELFYTQTLEGGDNVGNPELVKVLTENAYDGLQWLKSLGMVFEETIIQGAGSLHPRTHQSVDPLGTGFINAYENNLKNKDSVQILLETTAEELIEEDGKIVGVKGKYKDGSDVVFKANKGVIIATGGFAKNTEMVLEYNTSGKWPNLDENTVSTNIDSIRGDGIRMAKEIGADLVDMEQMQFLYLGIPKLGHISGLVDLGAENTIFINSQGNRFVREDGRRDLISSAIFEQENGQMYLMHSNNNVDMATETSLEGVPLTELIESHKYGWQSGETIEEFAENIGVPAENLEKTIEEYNNSIDSQEDQFGRELLTKKMLEGPYFAVPRVPSLHHTMGGIRIDTETRVLDMDGNPIKGLYAAGEVTGGIHGANRLGGNAVVDTVVFGRIAGESASLEK